VADQNKDQKNREHAWRKLPAVNVDINGGGFNAREIISTSKEDYIKKAKERHADAHWLRRRNADEFFGDVYDDAKQAVEDFDAQAAQAEADLAGDAKAETGRDPKPNAPSPARSNASGVANQTQTSLTGGTGAGGNAGNSAPKA
jgi:hypothetical protein